MEIDGSRMVAILIVNGKVYESDCDHQECLEEYYKDAKIKSPFDYSEPNKYDIVQEEAMKETYRLKETHEAYGYDVFDSVGFDKYLLIAHDEETLKATIKWARQYAKDNDCLIAHFNRGYDITLKGE